MFKLPSFSRTGAALRALLVAGALLLPISLPQPALAQLPGAEVYEGADARIRGYMQEGVVMQHRTPALTYFALAGMAVLAIAVLFKTARRTHLD